jgi:hypothetical protein
VLWQVTAVMGLDWLLKRFTSKAVLIWRLSLIFIMLGASQYAYQLFMVYPNQQHALQPQFDQVVQQIEAEHPTTPVAIVDPAGYHYILLAWYLKLPPETYFNSIIRQNPDQIGFRYGQQLTHYHFIANPNDRSSDEPILVQWSEENLIWQIKKDL